jgi:hypothetical protein
VYAITERSVSPRGDDIEELHEDMAHYVAAMLRSVIRYEDIGVSTSIGYRVQRSVIAGGAGFILIMAAFLIWGFEPPILPVTTLMLGIVSTIYGVILYAIENIREDEASNGKG